MKRDERILYHQLHPLKLLTDVASSFASSWLLWEAAWATAAVVAFVPSIAVSLLLLWRADLEPYRDSPMGRYVAIFMTRSATATRIGGQLVMWAGAVTHVPWLLPLGMMVVLFGWLQGLWVPAPQR